MTQGSLGDGVLRRRGEPELGRSLFRRRELQRATDVRLACSDSHDRVDQLASSSCCRLESTWSVSHQSTAHPGPGRP